MQEILIQYISEPSKLDNLQLVSMLYHQCSFLTFFHEIVFSFSLNDNDHLYLKHNQILHFTTQ